MKKLVLLIAAVCSFATHSFAEVCSGQGCDFSKNDYIAEYGRLKLVGNQLSSSDGKPVQLRGWSSFGWMNQWGDCHSEGAIQQMKTWGASIYRGAMYVNEGGYNNDKPGFTQITKDLIDLTARYKMYYLCDWHVLTPGNPNDGSYSDAANYFREISSYVKQKGYTHVLYEICNEPNGCSWSDIKTYADKVIPVIQDNDPEAIIVVGTPQWDQLIDQAQNDPITKYGNYLMYSFHFYSCSHMQFMPKLESAARNIPVFISEWGIAEFSGGEGTRDVAQSCISAADNLMNVANGSNGQKISWCCWSFGQKNEQASAVMSCGSLEPSPTGKVVIGYLGADPKFKIKKTACYEGQCAAIPGVLDLGKYDLNIDEDGETILDGEGVTYHEENTVADEVNDRSDCNGAFKWAGEDYTFRIDECVDVSGCYGITGAEGYYNLGYIEPGEWTVYTVEVEEPGYYSIEALLNPTTTGQVLDISSVTYCTNILVDLDTKEPISSLSFVTDLPDMGDSENWQYWKWYKPVEDINLGYATYVNNGVLFKTAGKQTIKVTFQQSPFVETDNIKTAGDMGPLKFTKVASYDGPGFEPCGGTSDAKEVLNDGSIAIYPTNNDGSFSVSAEGNANVTVFNMMGQAVYSTAISSNATVNTGLTSGNYIVKVEAEGSVAIEKITVNK